MSDNYWAMCSVADCDYHANIEMGKNLCYAHSLGKNPIMSCEKYQNQKSDKDGFILNAIGDKVRLAED